MISLLLFWWICWDIQKKSTEPCLVLAGARLPKGIAFLAKDSDDFVKGCWWRVMVGWQKLWRLDRIGTSGDSGWRSSFSWWFACGDEIPESLKESTVGENLQQSGVTIQMIMPCFLSFLLNVVLNCRLISLPISFWGDSSTNDTVGFRNGCFPPMDRFHAFRNHRCCTGFGSCYQVGMYYANPVCDSVVAGRTSCTSQILVYWVADSWWQSVCKCIWIFCDLAWAEWIERPLTFRHFYHPCSRYDP